MRPIDCRQKNIPIRRKAGNVAFEPPSPVDCRKRKRGRSFTKILVLFLLIALNWFGLSAITGTVAYYFDSELSAGNLFDAALLDFELSSPGDFAPEVSTEQEAARQISVTDVQSIAFHYNVQAENFSGGLCELLNVRATLDGDQKYLGPLIGFEAGDFGFADPEDWDFEAILTASNSGAACEFDFVFSGWQIPFPIIFSGFHDVERIHSTIGTEAAQCDALSIGYWRNHEGCSQNAGASVWAAEVNNLSSTFSAAFSSIDGAQICQALWIPNCPGGNTAESKLCKAKAHTLADELNIVSDRLQLNALVAGADDGTEAFDNLGVSENSTIQEALVIVEAILADSAATIAELTDAAYIAERIYAFYEDENINWPACVYDLGGGEIQSSVEEPAETVVEPPAVTEETPVEPSAEAEEPVVEPSEPAQNPPEEEQVNEE